MQMKFGQTYLYIVIKTSLLNNDYTVENAHKYI